jgi:hypothetical protein
MRIRAERGRGSRGVDVLLLALLLALASSSASSLCPGRFEFVSPSRDMVRPLKFLLMAIVVARRLLSSCCRPRCEHWALINFLIMADNLAKAVLR